MYLAKQSRTVLDIGANTGLFALTAATVSPTAKVHAFEPVPRIARLLRDNTTLNEKLSIQIHECAVGEHDGFADIYDPGGDNCYSASLNPNFLAGTKTSYSIPVVSIDKLVADGALPSVDLVKIDVEGFEAFVLQGMKESIERFRPSMMLEFLDEEDAALRQQMEQLLRQNYGLFLCDEKGLVRCSKVRKSEHSRNVFLIPLEKNLAGLQTVNGR